jgi:hypothetical protein
MSHDPRRITHVCEQCRRNTELTHVKSVDQYLCEDCTLWVAARYEEDLAAEAAYEASAEYFDRYLAGDHK